MNYIKKIVVAILTLESRLVIKKYKPFIVAVTGSVGKTSAKDAIYAILAARGGHVRKSDKSFNSEIGMPLTVLGVANAWRDPSAWFSNICRGLDLIFFKNEYPDTLVLEAGADHPGDIGRLVSCFKPDIAVISKVGDVPVHVEFFPSVEAVLKEKLKLAQAVKKGGTVVLYADDAKLKDLKFDGRTVMTYGLDKDSTVKGSQPSILCKEDGVIKKPAGISFTLENNGKSAQIALDGVLGAQHEYPVLAAAAVGIARGMNLEAVVKAVQGYEPPRGRMNIIAGIKGSTIIDDSYNSSPTALALALAALGEIEGATRKIAVLGDMMELGSFSVDEHRKAGALVAQTLDADRVDLLVTVGQRAKRIGEGAIEAGMKSSRIYSFDDSNEAAAKIKDIMKAGDIILVKGSQSPRMERITKALMAEPTRAAELLVRQEKEWLEKK